MGRVSDEEMAIFLKQATADERSNGESATKGLTNSQAKQQSQRCLRCDCRKRDGCQLRDLATATGARQKAFDVERSLFEQIAGAENVIFEPGKCIKCGLCIQAAQQKGERLGLSFAGRGFRMQVTSPLNKNFNEALEIAATECAKICPTGAIALNESN